MSCETKETLTQRYFAGKSSHAAYALWAIWCIIVVAVTSLIINHSTVLDYFDMKCVTYFRMYGKSNPTNGQYYMCGIAAIFNLAHMLWLYLTVDTWFSHVKPAERGNSGVAKVVAGFLCLLAYLGLTTFCALCKRNAKISIWDYYIFLAICRMIWVAVVGKNPNGTGRM